MYLETFVIHAILNIATAHYPVIIQKDNSIISTEPMQPHHKIIPVNYSSYEVVTNTHRTTTTEAPETLESDSLPADLIEIAATKLGIRNLDEIPSLSELSNLLGTTSREETIKTIRELTATESGIDLIKAFIESSDYTDNTPDKETEYIQIEAETSKPPVPTILFSETTQKDFDIIRKVLDTPQKDLGFFQRIYSYLNIFDFFPENKEILLSGDENEVPEIKPKAEDKNQHESHHQRHSKLQPISVTNSFPNSFPVPDTSGAFSPTLAPSSTHRAMKEDRHFLKLRTLSPSAGERFLN